MEEVISFVVLSMIIIILCGIIACLISEIDCLKLKIGDYEEKIAFIKNELNKKQLNYFENCKKFFPKVEEVLSVEIRDKETGQIVCCFDANDLKIEQEKGNKK